MDTLIDFPTIMKRFFFTKLEDESNFEDWLSEKTNYSNGNFHIGVD